MELANDGERLQHWLADYMHGTALFHTVVLYDVMRVLRVRMQSLLKSASSRTEPGSNATDAWWLNELIDRLLDRPASTFWGTIGASIFGPQILDFLDAVSSWHPHAPPRLVGWQQWQYLRWLQRERRREPLQRWRVAQRLRQVLAHVLSNGAVSQGIQSPSMHAHAHSLLSANVAERDRLEMVRRHLELCLCDCGTRGGNAALRASKCESVFVCSPHLQRSFSSTVQQVCVCVDACVRVCMCAHVRECVKPKKRICIYVYVCL